MSMLCGELKNE